MMNEYSREQLIKILNEEFLSIKEAASFLNISRQRLNTLVTEGKLELIQKDGVKLFLKKDVEEQKKELEQLRKKYRPYDY